MKSTILACIRISRPRAPRHSFPALRRPHIHRLWALLCVGIDTNINGSVQAIRDRLANEADLQYRVVSALLAHIEEGVCGVGCLDLFVSVIGWGLLDLAEEVLLDVKLANVGDGAACDGVVGEELSTVVNDGCTGLALGQRLVEEVELTVEMVGTTDIVAGDDGDEGGGAVRTGGLETA
jgi:hypothetical protein